KHVEQGNLDRSVLLNDLPEFRGFVDLEANIERGTHEEEGQEERYAPSPCDELVVGKQSHQRDDTARSQIADRRTVLRHRAVERALLGWGVLDDHEDGTAAFTADRRSLDDAQRNEEDRRQNSDRVVGREQPDRA